MTNHVLAKTPPQGSPSPIAAGNRALREGDYAAAIAHYLHGLQATPALGKTIVGNIALAKKKYRQALDSQQITARPRVAICGWEFAHNVADRGYTLAKLYETFAEVEIIGSIFPQHGKDMWELIRSTTFPLHSFVVEDEGHFLDQAMQLVAAHPYDVVHLAKPRAPNIFFGILYKLIWDAKVLVDIDDDELAFVGAKTPISIDDYLKAHGSLPTLKNLGGTDWTRIAVGLAKEFDGITVSNRVLQQRYDGEIICQMPDHPNHTANAQEAGHHYSLPELSFNINALRLEQFLEALNTHGQLLTYPLIELATSPTLALSMFFNDHQYTPKAYAGSGYSSVRTKPTNGSTTSTTLAIQTDGVDPHFHFHLLGWKEGRWPNVIFASLPPRTIVDVSNVDPVKRLFDSDYYASRNPDVAVAGMDLFEHFCNIGWQEGRSPNALFSVQQYFNLNPDVRRAGINPLLHYMLSGWREGRDVGGIFDSQFYLDAYSDARDTGLNPLEHFVFSGINHRHRPNRVLDPAAFLSEEDMALSPWQRTTLLIEHIENLAEAVEPVLLPHTDTPQLSIIVHAHDNATAVACCLTALMHAPPSLPFEVLIADDCSRDILPILVKRWPGVMHIRNDCAANWPQVINRAAAAARGDILVIIDGNAELLPGWAEELLDTLKRNPKAGLVGGKIVNVSGSLQHGGGLVWGDGSLTIRGAGNDSGHPRYSHLRPVDHVSPAFMAIRAELFMSIGGFSLDFLTLSYAAADIGRKVWREGWTVLYQPLAQMVRFADADISQNSQADLEQFRIKWVNVLDTLPDRPIQEGLDFRGVLGHVLVVDQITPAPDQDAGSVTQVFILDILLRLGWAVTFVPEATLENQPGYTASLQRIGIHCIYKPQYQSLYEFVRDEGHTVNLALLYRGPVALHYLNVIGPHCQNARILLDTVDVHFLREQREAEIAQSPDKMTRAMQTKQIELEAIRRSDCTIVLSKIEEELLRREVPEAKLTVLPLILDCPGLLAPLDDLRDICFIGGYRHQPNCDAVHYFVQEIWPMVRAKLPEVRFRIMGSHIPPDIQALEGNGVVIDGFVPDMATSLARCRLSVAPLRYGAGIKGKIGSSLSYGIPCVATSLAAEGMGFGSRDGIEVADDPADFANRIAHLYTDPEYWAKMSAWGLDLVAREYSLNAATDRIAAILHRLGLPVADQPFE